VIKTFLLVSTERNRNLSNGILLKVIHTQCNCKTTMSVYCLQAESTINAERLSHKKINDVQCNLSEQMLLFLSLPHPMLRKAEQCIMGIVVCPWSFMTTHL